MCEGLAFWASLIRAFSGRAWHGLGLGLGRKALGLQPGAGRFLVEHVGQERLWAVGPCKCILSAAEGNSPGPGSCFPSLHLQICR